MTRRHFFGILVVSLLLVAHLVCAKSKAKVDNSLSKKSAENQNDITVAIVEEHNDVLYYWFQAAKQNLIPSNGKGLHLLHFDSHADMAIPSTSSLFPQIHKDKLSSINVKKVVKKTNIGNFIPAATHMRLLSPSWTWVRSVWPDQEYNLKLGKHSAILATRKLSRRELNKRELSRMCMHSIEPRGDQTFEDVGYVGGLCFFDKKSQQNSSKSAEKVENEIEIQANVLSLQDALAQLPSENSLFNNANEPFLLDIDEDFFASHNPLMDGMAPFDKFGPMFTVLKELLNEKEFCISNNHSKIEELEELVHDIFWSTLTFTGNQTEPLIKTDAYRPELLTYWCNGTAHAHSTLVKITKLANLIMKPFDSLALALLKLDFDFPQFNCSNNGLFGVCMYGDPTNPNPSLQEIVNQVNLIKDLLLKIKARPALITIARSTDGYTPVHLQPFIEEKLLNMLANVYENHPVKKSSIQIEYHKGLKPVTKKQIKSVSKKDIFKVEQVDLKRVYDKLQYSTDENIVKGVAQRIAIHKKIEQVKEFMKENDLDSVHYVIPMLDTFKQWKRAKKKQTAAKTNKKNSNKRILRDEL